MTTRRTLLFGGIGLAGLSACSSGEPSQTTPPSSSPPTTGAGSSSLPPSGPPSSRAAPSSSAPASSAAPTALKIGEPTDLVTGLTTPWGLRALDDQTLVVSERDTGQIKIVRDGTATTIGEVAGVSPNSEAGLLGIEVSQDRSALFVYLSTTSDNRVLRYDFTGSAFSNPRVLVQGIPAAGFHNGGQLALGPDGHLYISTGDASNRQSAQDQNSLAGKVLRIAVDGSIPSDNPFGNAVWSMGHRNVQGLTFAPDGALWSAEFGDKSVDELNLITRAGNYGWPEVEGHQGQRSPFLAPKVTWEPTASSSPSSLAHAQGSVWVTSLIGSTLFQVPITGTEAGEPVAHFAQQYGRLRAVIAHRDGIVFGTSNTDGRSSPRSGDDRLVYLPLR